MVYKSLIDEMNRLKVARIFVLKVVDTNSVYIGYSSSVVNRVVELMDRDMFKGKKLELILMDDISKYNVKKHEILLRHLITAVAESYKQEGFVIMNPPQSFANFKVTAKRYYVKKQEKVSLYLTSSNSSKKILIGTFDGLEIAEQYASKHTITDLIKIILDIPIT